MKMLFCAVLVSIASATASADQAFYCATEVGRYNEVEKFRISNNDVEISKLGQGYQKVGTCSEQGNQVICTFSTNESIREYALSLSKVDDAQLQGEIGQALRRRAMVTCNLRSNSAG